MIKGIARVALAALLAGAIVPASAAAHATIVQTTPGDTAVLKTEPRTVTMKWSESVDLGTHSVRLLDGAGKEIKTPAPRHGPGGASTAVLALPPGLANGTYVVSWRVTSSDSHPVSGAFSFSIGSPSAVLFTAGGSSSATVRALDAIGRGIAFLGLAVTIGGAAVLFLLWPEGPASPRARRLLWTGIGALAGGSLFVLLLQGPYASGGSVTGLLDPSLISFSLSTRFGHALVVRIVLAAALAGLAALALRRGTARDPALAIPAAVCVLGLILTWTLTDHSRTGVQPWLGVPAASVHLLAMSLWFGGLVLLLGCVLGRPHVTLAPVVPRFSRMALGCFGALGVTGLYLAWRQVGEFPALPATDFGKLLLLKTGIVVVIIGLAFFSRRAVQRGSTDLGRQLRRSVGGEAFLGVAALGVTAVLVNTAPSRVSYVDPVSVTRPGPDGGSIQLKINPAKQGANVADVYLVARNGTLRQVPEVTARLLAPDGRTGPLNVAFGAAEPGHYVADRMTVPYPGHWTLRLQIRTSDIDESDVEIPVRNPMRRGLLVVLLFALLAPAASAHVTVIPATARPGETRTLTFRVLNERDDAKTVQVELFIPAGLHATASDRRGWTRVDKPGEVTWTATADAAIGGSSAKDFELRVGPLPKTERVVFKALQHYSDGQIVRWIQAPNPGAERPAPFVQLTATGRPGSTGGGSSATGFAILAALLALAAGAVALFLRRRRA